jgi:hypothetical protein
MHSTCLVLSRNDIPRLIPELGTSHYRSEAQVGKNSVRIGEHRCVVKRQGCSMPRAAGQQTQPRSIESVWQIGDQQGVIAGKRLPATCPVVRALQLRAGLSLLPVPSSSQLITKVCDQLLTWDTAQCLQDEKQSVAQLIAAQAALSAVASKAAGEARKQLQQSASRRCACVALGYCLCGGQIL